MLDSAVLERGCLRFPNRSSTPLERSTAKQARADDYHVFTKLGDGNVLVLIKSPNLKNLEMPARVALLHTIEAILTSQPQSKGKQQYIGVKGQITFGAIRVPPDQIKTGSVLVESPLYDFYGPSP